MPGVMLLKNGRVVDPANGIDQILDVLVADGRIKAVDQPGTLPEQAGGLVYDLAGKWVVPGLIDMHVHLR